MLNLKQFLIAIAVSASLVIAGGYSSSAIAGYSFVHSNVQKNKDGSTTIHTIIENDETGEQGVHWLQLHADGSYDQGVVVLGDTNPDPDGGGASHVDYKSLIEEAMKNGGTAWEKENHFLQSTLGQTLIKHSKTGSIVPYHNPDPGSYMPGDGYGGGTGGGFDPNNPTSIVDQLKKGKKKGKNKGNDDDGDSGDAGSDAQNPGYEFSADPALVNPVPINLPVAKPSKTKVHNLPAPALTQKGKGPIGNLTKYPDIPNLPSPTAATNQNRRSGSNPAAGMQSSPAVGNIQTMQGGGGSRRGVSHR